MPPSEYGENLPIGTRRIHNTKTGPQGRIKTVDGWKSCTLTDEERSAPRPKRATRQAGKRAPRKYLRPVKKAGSINVKCLPKKNTAAKWSTTANPAVIVIAKPKVPTKHVRVDSKTCIIVPVDVSDEVAIERWYAKRK